MSRNAHRCVHNDDKHHRMTPLIQSLNHSRFVTFRVSNFCCFPFFFQAKLMGLLFLSLWGVQLTGHLMTFIVLISCQKRWLNLMRRAWRHFIMLTCIHLIKCSPRNIVSDLSDVHGSPHVIWSMKLFCPAACITLPLSILNGVCCIITI